MKRVTGYLITPHNEDCGYFNGFNDNSFPWCLPEPKLVYCPDTQMKDYLYVFRCGDTSCPAQLGIKPNTFYRIIDAALQHLRSKGAPKRKKKS